MGGREVDTAMVMITILLLLRPPASSGACTSKQIILPVDPSLTPGLVFEQAGAGRRGSFCKEDQRPGSQIYSVLWFRSLKRLRWFHDGVGHGMDRSLPAVT